MRRLSKVKIEWSPAFSYAIGLIATDGNLSKDGRHLNFTSKDEDLVLTFKTCLGLDNRVGRKTRGGSKVKKYFQVQFGDRNFYEFLIQTGLTPAKSKTLGVLSIPEAYFSDFLRGCIDGDGNISIAKHPESQHPQLRIRLSSASKKFLEWIRQQITKHLALNGGWIDFSARAFVLTYAKDDSIKILNFIYKNKNTEYLDRKYAVAKYFLRV